MSSAVTRTPVANVCPRCGAPLDAGATYCGNCGTPLAATIQRTYAYPIASRQQVLAAHGPRIGGLAWIVVAALVAGVILVGVGAGLLLVGQGSGFSCDRPGCVAPPLAGPRPASVPYHSAAFGYDMDLSSNCGTDVRTAVTNDRSVSLVIDDSWPVTVWGEAAASRTPQQIVDSVQASKHPGARRLYALPMPEVGYVLGAGDVYEISLKPASGSAVAVRVIVMVAIKKGLAIGVDSIGPLYDPKDPPGHPDPAGTLFPVCWDSITNSVTWPGDQPL